jgi:hypothetical protein
MDSPNIDRVRHSKRTRNTGPYGRAFRQHLIDHKIFPHGYQYPTSGLVPTPDNLVEIAAVIAKLRASLSPSQFTSQNFADFWLLDNQASTEEQVRSAVIPILQGEIRDRQCVSGQIPFNNLDHLTDGSLVAGNPDVYYGARPEDLDPTIRACSFPRVNKTDPFCRISS